MTIARLQALANDPHAGLVARARDVAAVAGAVPSSLPPFWIACALTLIVAHYQLWDRLNIIYKIMSTVVVVMMPFTAGFKRLMSRPAVAWLLVFEAVMVLNMLLGRYYTVASLLSTASPPVILIRSLPFLLCGYTLAGNALWQRRFLLFVGVVYWLFAIQDARGFIAGARAQLGRTETYAQTQGLEDIRMGSVYVSAFIYFSPLVLFFAIMLFRLYPSLSKPWKLLVIAMQVTFATIAILSGFGATTMMVFLAIVLLSIYAPVKTIEWRLYYLGVSGAAFTIFELVRRTLLAQPGLGAAGQAFAKFTLLLQSLWAVFSGVDARALEKASSSRISLMMTSLETFCRNPLIGHGLAGETDLAVGGHSFLVDTAAIFGIVGFLPVALFFWLIYRGLRISGRTAGRSWPNSSSMIFLLTLIAGLVMNPYFLGLLSLSYFLFFMLGFALADGERQSAVPRRSPRPIAGHPHAVG